MGQDAGSSQGPERICKNARFPAGCDPLRGVNQQDVSNGCQQWLSAMAVSNGCQQWLSAMAVSNGCQQWLSTMAVSNGCQQCCCCCCFVFPPKTAFLEGFGPNGRHHANQREKTIRMVKFPAQTELLSGKRRPPPVHRMLSFPRGCWGEMVQRAGQHPVPTGCWGLRAAQHPALRPRHDGCLRKTEINPFENFR